jgi:putative transposase
MADQTATVQLELCQQGVLRWTSSRVQPSPSGAPALFHPLLTLIASATNRDLARYVQFLKEVNKILRSRLGDQVHTTPGERRRLVHFGKGLGRAIEELITIVAPSTFYRWVREELSGKKTPNPKGGQRKPRELRELVIEIAKTTGFGYTRPHSQYAPLRFA